MKNQDGESTFPIRLGQNTVKQSGSGQTNSGRRSLPPRPKQQHQVRPAIIFLFFSFSRERLSGVNEILYKEIVTSSDRRSEKSGRLFAFKTAGRKKNPAGIAGLSKTGGRWETRTLDLIRVKDAF